MQTETELWIEKLERALTERKQLPKMEPSARREVIQLMSSAGRHDLAAAARHHIPIQLGSNQLQPLRQFQREIEKRSS